MIEVAMLSIGVLVLVLTLGVPLPYCFGAALMVMYFLGDVTMKGMMLWGVQQLSNPILLAIPLFVLAGTIMSESGIAASLLRFVNAFIGHVRGGLGVVKVFQVLEIETTFTHRGERHYCTAQGSHGGQAGAPAVSVIHRASGQDEVTGNAHRPLHLTTVCRPMKGLRRVKASNRPTPMQSASREEPP